MPKRNIQLPTEYRFLVIGDSSVGKTSLIARYVRNEYPCRKTTDGLTVYETVIDGRDCVLRFVDLSTIYDIQKLKILDQIPTACLIIFSITDQNSFSQLNAFYETVRLKFAHEIPIIFIGNKIDLEYNRAVSQQSIDNLKFDGYDVFDVSVKGNVGIGDAIYTAIKHLQYEQYHLLEKVKPNSACACLIS